MIRKQHRCALPILVILMLFNAGNAQPPMLWTGQLGGDEIRSAECIDVDEKGAVYLYGTFTGTADFDPGSGTFLLSASGLDHFILKLRRDGSFAWARRIDLTYSNNQYLLGQISMKCDGDSGCYFTGGFNGIVDFDPGIGTYTLNAPGTGTDGFILKLDTAGNFKWVKQLNGLAIATEIVVGADHAVYSTGWFRSIVDFDPGPGAAVHATNGSDNSYLLRLTSGGSFSWVKILAGNMNGQALALAFDAKSMMCSFGGWANAGTDLDPGPGTSITQTICGYVCVLDTAGNTINNKALYGNCRVNSVSYNNGLILSCTFTGSVDIDPGPSQQVITPTGNWEEGFLLKLGNALAFVWVKEFRSQAGGKFDAGKIMSDNNNGIIYFGAFEGVYDMDPSSAVYTLSSVQGPATKTAKDYLFCMFDAAGNLQWAHSYGPCRSPGTGHAMPAGDVYTAGIFLATVDFDPGAGTFTMGVSSSTNVPGFIQRFSRCSATLEPQVMSYATQYSLCAGESTTLVAAGAYKYKWSHGPSSAVVSVTPALSTVFEVQGIDTISGCFAFSTLSISVDACVSVAETALPGPQCYPNPVHDLLHLSVMEGAIITVYDLRGRMVVAPFTASRSREEVNLSGLEPGSYTVSVLYSGYRRVLHVIRI